MPPSLELYLHAQGSWMDEDSLPTLQEALTRLVDELLSLPVGPDHVLSTLEVVELNLVDDDTIAAVHGDFLQDPTPTDVITFHHGEIFVSLDTARRYAQQHELDEQEELFRYLVHGLVHLHGYLDDTTEHRDALFAVQEPLVARYCGTK